MALNFTQKGETILFPMLTNLDLEQPEATVCNGMANLAPSIPAQIKNRKIIKMFIIRKKHHFSLVFICSASKDTFILKR